MVSAVDPTAARESSGHPCGRARLEDAAAWIDAWAAPLVPETVGLAEAGGRVLAADAAAPIDLPPHDRAAADGFALQADETVGAGAYNALPFRLGPASERVGPGRTVAVQSGEVLPAGADAVVRPEHARPDARGSIAVIAAVFAGSDVEPRASQATRGSVLVSAGRRLGPVEIGQLASAGIACVSVVARPRVRCLVAAERAVEAGQALPAGAVYDANGPMLAALVAHDGGVVVERHLLGSGAERRNAVLRDALRAPGEPRADLVLVAGGTGPGANDGSAAALAEAGELSLHGVALCPGESAGAGRAGGVPVFLLPGTPAACLWAYEFLAGRAIRRLAGRAPELPFPVRTMRAARKIVSEIGMAEVCPVRCTGEADVEPIAPFAEAGLVSAAQADGFVLVPEASEGYPQGAPVPVYLYAARHTEPRWPRPPGV